MNIHIIVVLLSVVVMTGCGTEHPLKPGFVSARSDKQEINEAVKDELYIRSLEFYTYKEEGKEVIAHRKADEKIVKAIFIDVTGGPPEGYTGLCYEILRSAEKQQQLLLSQQITSIIRGSYSMHCVYWKKEDSDRVAEIDKDFKEIRTHQKQLGNKI